MGCPSVQLTLLVVGLLKHSLVKAAEGGTKIFEVREEQLLVAFRYVVLGLRGLLQAHGLGHRLWMTRHLKGEERRMTAVRGERTQD